MRCLSHLQLITCKTQKVSEYVFEHYGKQYHTNRPTGVEKQLLYAIKQSYKHHQHGGKTNLFKFKHCRARNSF